VDAGGLVPAGRAALIHGDTTAPDASVLAGVRGRARGYASHMMRRRPFQTQRFDHVAGAVVSATLASVGAGCGGIDLDGMEPPACRNEEVDLLGDLKLVRSFDSIELARTEYAPPFEVYATSGTRCGTAVDAAACNAAVDAILAPVDDSGGELATPADGFQFGQCVDLCERHVAVLTRGDEVIAVRDAGSMLLQLGDIDTPTEAIWAVRLDGYSVGCDAETFGVREADGGYEVAATQLTSACEPVETTQYLLAVSRKAAVSVLDDSVIDSFSGCVGRRPEQLRADPGRGRTTVGARLASLAQLEAASVPAFTSLAADLREHGAPRSLRLAARRARADEVRHALAMRRHARRHGGVPRSPQASPRRSRSLVDIAIENAREGCVREAYGAVVARFQATRAGDVVLRRALEVIAGDEAKHATLALRVDAWARRRLGPADRARVETARREAIAELRAQLVLDDPGPEVAAALGLPRPAEARALLDALVRVMGADATTTA
jgi:hypothetical protein